MILININEFRFPAPFRTHSLCNDRVFAEVTSLCELTMVSSLDGKSVCWVTRIDGERMADVDGVVVILWDEGDMSSLFQHHFS